MSFEDEIIASPVNVPGSWARRRLGDVLPLAYGKALHARVRSIDGKIPVYGSAGIAGYHDEALCHEAGLIVGRKGSAGSTYHSQIPFFPIDTAYYCTKSRADMDLRLGYHLLTHLNLRQLDQSTAVPSLGRDTYNDIVVAVRQSRSRPLLPPVSMSFLMRSTMARWRWRRRGAILRLGASPC